MSMLTLIFTIINALAACTTAGLMIYFWKHTFESYSCHKAIKVSFKKFEKSIKNKSDYSFSTLQTDLIKIIKTAVNPALARNEAIKYTSKLRKKGKITCADLEDCLFNLVLNTYELIDKQDRTIE